MIALSGNHHTGKTTVAEAVISGLNDRGYKVSTIKNIHIEDFSLEKEGSSTHRHHKAGADTVAALGPNQSGLLWGRKVPLKEIMQLIHADWVILEGFKKEPVLKIVTGKTIDDLEEVCDPYTLAVSGIISENIGDEYQGRPVLNARKDSGKLVDLLEERVPRILPGMDCGGCGHGDCDGMLKALVTRDASPSDCINLGEHRVRVFIDGEPIPTKKFVGEVIEGVTRGMLSAIKGYKENANIQITVEGKEKREKK